MRVNYPNRIRQNIVCHSCTIHNSKLMSSHIRCKWNTIIIKICMFLLWLKCFYSHNNLVKIIVIKQNNSNLFICKAFCLHSTNNLDTITIYISMNIIFTTIHISRIIDFTAIYIDRIIILIVIYRKDYDFYINLLFI